MEDLQIFRTLFVPDASLFEQYNGNKKQTYRPNSSRIDGCINETVNILACYVDVLQSDLINPSSEAGKKAKTCELERFL